MRILAVLALVGANAFFVIGEYAVVTARRGALAAKAEAGSHGARAALALMDDPVRVISTVQVGITAIGILTGAIGEPLVRDLLGEGMPSWLSFVLAFATVTYLSVVFGELVPKALTLERAESLASVVAPPITAISIVFRPVVWVLQGSAALLLRPFGVRDVVVGDSISSPDELRAIVDEAEGAGVIPRSQEEMLHKVFTFADLEVGDVMAPEPEVAWLEAEMPAEQALDLVVRKPHERYPVGRGTLDRVVGIVHVRDLLAAARGERSTTVGELARPAHAVPATKDLGALLRELRERREQLAIVVDEYGATAGVVSLEDVVERIVGEIEDEYDLPDAAITRIDERTVEIAGSITIDDLNEELGLELPRTRSRTIAGLTFETVGRRPKPGDEVEVAGVGLRVLEIDELRITRLRLTLPQA